MVLHGNWFALFASSERRANVRVITWLPLIVGYQDYQAKREHDYFFYRQAPKFQHQAASKRVLNVIFPYINIRQ